MARIGILIALTVTWVIPAVAGGRIERLQLTSNVLGSAGFTASRRINIYLPPDYDTSRAQYPTLYFLHGQTGTERTFLGGGYPELGGALSEVHFDAVADKLIEDGKIKPMILVFPNITGAWRKGYTPYADYLANEVVPLIDHRFRTISNRNARALVGHSRGGVGAFYTALMHPETFGWVGGCASGPAPLPSRKLLDAYPQAEYPLRFWVYAGRRDHFHYAEINQEFVQELKATRFPHLYIEDDGTHWSHIEAQLADFAVYVSQAMGGK